MVHIIGADSRVLTGLLLASPFRYNNDSNNNMNDWEVPNQTILMAFNKETRDKLVEVVN